MNPCQIIVRIIQDSDGMHVGEEECGQPGIIFSTYWFCHDCALDTAKDGGYIPS